MILLATAGTCWAQPVVSVAYARFQAEQQPYLELYLTADRRSLRAGADGRHSLDVTVLFEQEGQVRLVDKVTLHAPSADSVTSFAEALRYPLAAGDYTLRVLGQDANALPEDTLTLKLATPLTVASPSATVQLSDIQLASAARPAAEGEEATMLNKSGQVLEPLDGNIVRGRLKSVLAYFEIYNPRPEPNTPLLLEYTLARLEDGQRKDLFRKNRKLTSGQAVQSLLVQLSTAEQRSGAYLLEVSVRDQRLQVIAQRQSVFQIYNPAVDAQLDDKPPVDDWTQLIDADSLNYVLLSLMPVVTTTASQNIEAAIENPSEEVKREEIFNHFAGVSPKGPQQAYRAYLDVVREVDVAFQAGFGYGFQTDRGQIWLRYGQPNDRLEVSNDPSAPPYEIWIYNYVERTRQTPGKFLFYNPILDNANYVLLHSTVRGEIYDPRWRRVLYSRTINEFGDNDTVQGTSVNDNVGRYADQYFNDF